MKKLIFKWSELKATFWFIPVILIITSVLLSIGLVYLDGQISVAQIGIGRFFFVNSSDSARSILATISGAMMGVAGTVFSITLVALTLASSQFGPRLIKNFMYVRLNQVVLGAYISTYLYCLLILNAVTESDGYTFIPSISILVAILAAITNIILLIFFIHRIATSIQADELISDISDFISEQVENLFPEKMGEEREESTDIASYTAAYKNTISIKSPKNGYLQHVDSEGLMEVVCHYDSIFQLHYRNGGYVVKGLEIGLLYTNEKWGKEEINKIFDKFVIGKTKTAQQDLEFSIHQMVEIALRALSPGINDPFTAITCIDNLTATMSYLAQVKFPSRYRFDESGNLRVIADALDFEGVLDAAFNQIRQCSGGSAAVIIRLMEGLTTIADFTSKKKHKEAVIKHAEMVLRIGKQTMKEENDLKDLSERADKILKPMK